MKECAEDNFKFDENDREFFKWVENAVGKGEITPCPTVFSKDLFWKNVKTRVCLSLKSLKILWEKEKTQNLLVMG